MEKEKQILTNEEDNREYLEIVGNLKKEFKNKIKEEIESVQKKLSRQALDLLGAEFTLLLSERKALLDKFKVSGKKLLNYAKERGFISELTNLENWSSKQEKELDRKGEGSKLFEDIIKKVQIYNPALTEEVLKIQSELLSNNKQVSALVSEKKPLIDKMQKESRAPLQKIIVDLVVEFNKKIQVVNAEFGLNITKAISPFEDGEKASDSVQISISDDVDDSFFISPTSGDDVLN